MKRKIPVVMIALAVLLSGATVSNAQLNGKCHQLGLKFGYWNGFDGNSTIVSIDGISTTVNSGSVGGGIYYGYWLNDGLAVIVDVGGKSPEVETKINTGGIAIQNIYFGHIHIGMKMYPIKSTHNAGVRPYGMISVGPYIASLSETKVGFTVAAEERNSVAFGGFIGAGIDFNIGQRFMMETGIGYNLVSDYDESIGGKKNYSGGEFTMGVSYLFGR